VPTETDNASTNRSVNTDLKNRHGSTLRKWCPKLISLRALGVLGDSVVMLFAW